MSGASRFVFAIVLSLVGGAGCTRESQNESSSRFQKTARITVKSDVLDAFTGTYALPSGALFPVIRQQNQLLAGIPPYEILPQTTREFASNRLLARIIFDREKNSPAHRVNLQVGTQDTWAHRIDPGAVEDPTQMVDAGGHLLRMLVTGDDGPTIVIEDGFGSSIIMSSKLQSELSNFCRVVAYDHAETGGSEAGPRPRHALQVACELRTALQNAGLDPPYVLVGASIGADYISVFAHTYPRDVAGLVRLDPTPDWEALQQWMNVHAPTRAGEHQKVVRQNHDTLPEIMKYQEPGRQAEWAALQQTRDMARNALPLPKVPVVQITGAARHQSNHQAHDKVRFFGDWLKANMPSARHVLAENSGHAVYAADAGLVVREIRQLVDDIRSGARR